MKGLECSEEMEYNKTSETDYTNKDDMSQNISEDMGLSDNSENEICRDDLSENILEDVEKNNNSKINTSNREDLSEKKSS